MGSTQSLVEEHEPHQVSVQHHSPRLINVKLPHQDTCESDGGILEDIGECRVEVHMKKGKCSLPKNKRKMVNR